MMVCYPCQNFQCGDAREVIAAKIDVLETSLLRDELCEKVYVGTSFSFNVEIFKPGIVKSNIEICDRFDVRA